MEELTKYQIVLLTLFISFVTSIATGIVTVSLMDQSPQGITQNINRVVERTIERVVESPIGGTVTEVKVPVVVSEEELIVRVVNTAMPSVGKIVRKQGDKVEPVGIAFGFISGWLVAGPILAELPSDALYEVRLPNGESAKIEKLERRLEGNLTFIKIAEVVPTMILSGKKSQIGQTVMTLGSIADERQGISVGIVSSVSGEGGATVPTYLRTNAVTSDNVGGPLVNIQGELVGVSLKSGLALSVESLKQQFDLIK